MIASLSARVGSIGDNSLGGWYSYRASKTALNQVRPRVRAGALQTPSAPSKGCISNDRSKTLIQTYSICLTPHMEAERGVRTQA